MSDVTTSTLNANDEEDELPQPDDTIDLGFDDDVKVWVADTHDEEQAKSSFLKVWDQAAQTTGARGKYNVYIDQQVAPFIAMVDNANKNGAKYGKPLPWKQFLKLAVLRLDGKYYQIGGTQVNLKNIDTKMLFEKKVLCLNKSKNADRKPCWTLQNYKHFGKESYNNLKAQNGHVKEASFEKSVCSSGHLNYRLALGQLWNQFQDNWRDIRMKTPGPGPARHGKPADSESAVKDAEVVPSESSMPLAPYGGAPYAKLVRSSTYESPDATLPGMSAKELFSSMQKVLQSQK